MSLWRQLTSGVRGVIREEAAHRDTADEVEHYVDQAAAELRAQGMSAADARRAALIEAGNLGSANANFTESGVMWQTLIHLTFILSAVGIALVDRLSQPAFAPSRRADDHV